eukprot:2332883-Rhodomonas_salina.3
MPGTDIAHGGICLRSYYAISGAIRLRACHAMTGNDVANGATRGGSGDKEQGGRGKENPVASPPTVLGDSYAMSDTATRLLCNVRY